jgi:hypothetical protein
MGQQMTGNLRAYGAATLDHRQHVLADGRQRAALEHVAAGAGSQRLDHARLVAENADDKGFAVPVGCGHGPDDLDAGPVGQAEIDEHDARLVFEQLVQAAVDITCDRRRR